MERIPLRSSDPAALAALVAERLRAGALVALPTETVYGLACLPAAAERVRALLQRPAEAPCTLHLPSRADVRPLVAGMPLGAERLIERFWPGPLTLVLPGRAGGEVAVRLPAHEFTRAVIAAVGSPLPMPALHAPGTPALADPDAVAARFGHGLDLLVDDGKSPLGTPSTVAHFHGGRLDVRREGILTADEVQQAAATVVLFVCTGNTCRSPLAEAFARQHSAAALGVPPEDLLAHGLCFRSAGTGACDGDPASDGSLAAGAEVGLDLSTHRSTALDPGLVRRAHRIYCLADSHRRNTLAEAPAAGEKITLLRPDQRDVADPFGGDLRAYRRARDEIGAAVLARLADWLPKRA